MFRINQNTRKTVLPSSGLPGYSTKTSCSLVFKGLHSLLSVLVGRRAGLGVCRRWEWRFADLVGGQCGNAVTQAESRLHL